MRWILPVCRNLLNRRHVLGFFIILSGTARDFLNRSSKRSRTVRLGPKTSKFRIKCRIEVLANISKIHLRNSWYAFSESSDPIHYLQSKKASRERRLSWKLFAEPGKKTFNSFVTKVPFLYALITVKIHIKQTGSTLCTKVPIQFVQCMIFFLKPFINYFPKGLSPSVANLRKWDHWPYHFVCSDMCTCMQMCMQA